MWHWWQTAAAEEGPDAESQAREAAEKEIVAKVQVLAREEPKKGLRRIDPAELEQKREDWRREVEQAREWLRERNIEPRRALDIWWRKHGRTLRTDRKFQNRRNVLRQLGMRGKA